MRAQEATCRTCGEAFIGPLVGYTVLLQGALISKATRRLRNAIFGQASETRTAPFMFG